MYGVYGPAGAPKDAKIAVTVVNNDGGASYTVDAELNTVHQAKSDPNYVACTECPGPYATWKALLPPTAAGGNYTIEKQAPPSLPSPFTLPPHIFR